MTMVEPIYFGSLTEHLYGSPGTADPSASAEDASANAVDKPNCVICMSAMEEEPQYTIPECSHEFHQNCIMQWFRQGNRKCPLCNNLGVSSGFYGYSHRQRRYEGAKLLRRMARKKSAPKILKQRVAALKKLEDKLAALKNAKKSLLSKEGKFEDILREHNAMRRKVRKAEWSVKAAKMNLGAGYIIPMIIAQKKVID